MHRSLRVTSTTMRHSKHAKTARPALAFAVADGERHRADCYERSREPRSDKGVYGTRPDTRDANGRNLGTAAYAKPLGYPGDFEIMNQVYDWKRVGHGAYEMLLHRIGLEVAECIKTRMEIVRGIIGETSRREVGRTARDIEPRQRAGPRNRTVPCKRCGAKRPCGVHADRPGTSGAAICA